jgi:hypothetical protein
LSCPFRGIRFTAALALGERFPDSEADGAIQLASRLAADLDRFFQLLFDSCHARVRARLRSGLLLQQELHGTFEIHLQPRL